MNAAELAWKRIMRRRREGKGFVPTIMTNEAYCELSERHPTRSFGLAPRFVPAADLVYMGC